MNLYNFSVLKTNNILHF